jgi:DNA-binding transcriptional MerR regulator
VNSEGWTGWTIDELAQRAAEALAGDGVRAPNGRVTAVPDRRLIRWYATIGLLDRPLRARGRTARYGPRHLLQLVAVKRRQAEGRTLAEIQAELAGATDATLRAAAGADFSGSWSPVAAGTATDDQDRAGFWRELPVRSAPPVSPVPLHAAATLVLYASPTPDDLAAIRTAARPLLDLLADRGLLPEPPPDPTQRRPA